MRKSSAGHVTKTMNSHVPTQNFALKLQGKCWKDDVVTFIAHLNVTIKHLTRYKQKVVLTTMLAANTNHATLVKNQSAIKCLL